jgi:diketogulonate reductase-like aldo/keto reductase
LNPFQNYIHQIKINNIAVQAYSPLARGKFNNERIIIELAKKHNKTGGQVMLRWAVQHGTVPIPKTATNDRMVENLSIFDFELTEDEMDVINNLSGGKFLVVDPNTID